MFFKLFLNLFMAVLLPSRFAASISLSAFIVKYADSIRFFILSFA
nr:MAG TPA: hypothetical protein [Caudoviricetes sp.]